MTDIVKKLRSPVDEKEDYFVSQWPGEEPKTHDAVRFQGADEIERLRAVLRMLYDEMDEYQRINNLSAYNNQVMRQARAALGVE